MGKRVGFAVHPRDGSRGPAAYLGAATVGTDGAEDVQAGSSGQEWFLFQAGEDRATDLHDKAFVNDLDFING